MSARPNAAEDARAAATAPRRGRLLAAWRATLDASGLFAGLLIAVICVGICTDVALRWTGAGGVSWMLETIEYVQYLMVLVGAAWVLSRGAHVAIDAILMAVSEKTCRRMERSASAFGAITSGVFSAACSAAAIDTFRTGSILHKSITLPEWLPLAILALSFLTLTIEFALRAAGRGEVREALDL
ncbi:MAG: TRAP transporter small permease subunit [Betaproteobacteria bacterium]|nr:TRAP transporter small permease subunit [Betaproteobacteria bacterium]